MTIVGDQPAAPAAPQAQALGKGGSNSSPDVARERRYGRRDLRWKLRKVTKLASVACCGKAARGDVELRGAQLVGMVGLHGLNSCGSPWGCPVCSAKIDAVRSAELEAMILVALAQGYVLGFLTLTVRHRRRDSLARLLDAVATGWTAATSGKYWAVDCATYGLDLGGARPRIGFVRRAEVTHGWRNGWHPHLHPLLFFRPGTTEPEVQEVCDRLAGRWVRAVGRSGLDAPIPRQQVVRVITSSSTDSEVGEAVASYLAKGVAMELALTRTKGRRTARSTENPWAILERFFDTGDAADLRIWHEYEAATKGRRAMTWAVGLRRHLLGSEDAPTDEEIASQELGDADQVLGIIFGRDWPRIAASRHLDRAVVEVAEKDGMRALGRLLAVHGIGLVLGPAAAAWDARFQQQ